MNKSKTSLEPRPNSGAEVSCLENLVVNNYLFETIYLENLLAVNKLNKQKKKKKTIAIITNLSLYFGYVFVTLPHSFSSRLGRLYQDSIVRWCQSYFTECSCYFLT